MSENMIKKEKEAMTSHFPIVENELIDYCEMVLKDPKPYRYERILACVEVRAELLNKRARQSANS